MFRTMNKKIEKRPKCLVRLWITITLSSPFSPLYTAKVSVIKIYF